MNRFRTGGWSPARLLSAVDFAQIGALAVLLVIGVVFIHSTGVQSGVPGGGGYFFRQIQWIAIGMVSYGILACSDYRKWAGLSLIFYPVCIGLLVAVLFIGTRGGGAMRWITVPGVHFRLQPSEFMKLSLIFMLAGLFSSRMFTIEPVETLSSRSRKPPQWSRILLAAGLIGVPFFLILKEPDLGSALVLPPIGAAIIFTAGIRRKLIAWLAGAGLVIFLVVLGNEFWPRRDVHPSTGAVTISFPGIHPFLHNYQRERMLTFFDPERDLFKYGYNRHQALLAVGSGGLWGKGIGQGTQNQLGFLPQSVSNNDFIFAVIAEETGFFGCMVLFGAYLMLFYSIFRTALICGNAYGRYFAVGTATMLFVHIFINTGMSTGVTPVTGLSLPLISYGGSFMITTLASLGILQSIYRFSPRED